MENMNELYSDIILEHNQCQENKHPLEDANLSEHGHNPSCGDDITLQADIQDGVIKDAAYTGHGCAISQASADIMIDLIKGMPAGALLPWCKEPVPKGLCRWRGKDSENCHRPAGPV